MNGHRRNHRRVSGAIRRRITNIICGTVGTAFFLLTVGIIGGMEQGFMPVLPGLAWGALCVGGMAACVWVVA